MVRLERMTLMEARNALWMDIDEAHRLEVLPGTIHDYHLDRITQEIARGPILTAGDEIPLAICMRVWEQDERERMQREQADSQKSNRRNVNDGIDTRHSNRGQVQVHLDHLKCEGPFGSSNGVVGGGAEQQLVQLDYPRVNQEELAVDRRSEELDVSGSLLGVDCQ
jgi:hypothetical protein